MATPLRIRPPSGNIDFAVIGESWEVFKRHAGLFVLVGAIMFLLSILQQVVSIMLTGGFDEIFSAQPQSWTEFFMDMAVSMGTGVGYWVIVAFLQFGIVAVTLKSLHGQEPTNSDLFSGLEHPIAVLVAALLMVVISYLGMVACFIGMIFTSGLVMCVFPAMVQERLGPIDAIKRSFALVGPHWLTAGLLTLVLGIIYALVLCCTLTFGLIVFLPMLFIIQALVYKDLAGDELYRQHQQYERPSPSPYPRGQEPPPDA